MEIFEKRGQWCFRDERGILHKYSSEAEAEAGLAVITQPIPLPDVVEYESLEEAIADQDADEDEVLAEEN